MTKPTLVVVGGGAAGFFCAVNAARLAPHLAVTILEKSNKVLQKVKVSGGGRCNATHWGKPRAAMAKCYPRGEAFCKKLFGHFFVDDTIEWFEKRGVHLVAEADGRMFPDTNNSETIMACLLDEAKQFDVQVLTGKTVAAFSPADEGFNITLSNGDALMANYLCIASGGYHYVQQFDWITAATDHTVVPPVPSLFTFNLPGHTLTALQGISVADVHLRIRQSSFESRGPLLITHWGISGPAVLRTSAFAARWLHEKNYAFEVGVNWLPAYNEHSLLQQMRNYRHEKPTQKIINTPWIDLPQRLLIYLLEEAGGNANLTWGDLPSVVQNKLAKQLCDYVLPAKGKTTFKEEFVTAGGIDLAEIDSNTMASKRLPGLYFAGEVINVDGITGGFNFQHAWSSGMVAAQAIAGKAGMQ